MKIFLILIPNLILNKKAGAKKKKTKKTKKKKQDDDGKVVQAEWNGNMVTPGDFVIEYSPSNRAVCRHSGCKEKIAKSDVRVGKVVKNHFGDGNTAGFQWYHMKCVFAYFVRARASTPVINSADDAKGLSDLKAADQKKFAKLLKRKKAGKTKPVSNAKVSTKGKSKNKKSKKNRKPRKQRTTTNKEEDDFSSDSDSDDEKERKGAKRKREEYEDEEDDKKVKAKPSAKRRKTATSDSPPKFLEKLEEFVEGLTRADLPKLTNKKVIKCIEKEINTELSSADCAKLKKHLAVLVKRKFRKKK
eukprot:TRINITY_DN22210_c0_g1_i1.p1 TRINITY_DN22210_c0_g1~~TRINITY_DN22210_c0_g1_i1.p1  ORF type:complete len:302 (-),score=86.10 TRINITY_DN22210_c0_g1_i1:11-916(-)